MTQKHINFALAIILIIGWFMRLGYDHEGESVSFYSIFYMALFNIDKLWISIIEFIVTGSVLGIVVSYVLTYFDDSILTKKWFKPFLFFSTIIIIGSFVLLHFTHLSLNLFFYIYHLLFYYFAYCVLQEIKA
mgnify:CR=1 FL=1